MQSYSGRYWALLNGHLPSPCPPRSARCLAGDLSNEGRKQRSQMQDLRAPQGAQSVAVVGVDLTVDETMKRQQTDRPASTSRAVCRPCMPSTAHIKCFERSGYPRQSKIGAKAVCKRKTETVYIAYDSYFVSQCFVDCILSALIFFFLFSKLCLQVKPLYPIAVSSYPSLNLHTAGVVG
jgi:hypothetical protein